MWKGLLVTTPMWKGLPVTTPMWKGPPVTTPVATAPAPSFTAFRTSSESGGELWPVAAGGGGSSKVPLLK